MQLSVKQRVSELEQELCLTAMDASEMDYLFHRLPTLLGMATVLTTSAEEDEGELEMTTQEDEEEE